MQFTVKLFAVARDLAGAAELKIDVPAHANVAALRAALRQRVPALAPLLTHMRIAVNSRYAADDESLNPDDEVAIIPPVSGG
jgi:molybdopterin synthase sulfur carrier subunit